MKRQIITLALSLVLVGMLGTVSFAASSDTATVGFEVQAINELDISGNPGTLTISTATAGSPPTAASDNTTTYALTTNEASKKITAKIDTAMPDGVTLTISLTAPTGGTSAGAVSLSTSDQDVVTAIGQQNESALGIAYELSATTAAGVVSSTSRTVTLTLTDSI